MGIEWRDYLAVGVDEIDNQHKELFTRFNSLLNACDEGKGDEEVKKLLGFLDDYVATHFRAEEKIQQEYGYPDYLHHKDQHRWFTDELAKLKGQFASQGPALGVVLSTNRFLVNWLIEHISKMDKVLGQYIKAHPK